MTRTMTTRKKRTTKRRRKKMKKFRERLQEKKEQILETFTKNKNYGKEADGEPSQDIADKAANSYTKEFLFNH